MSCSAAALPHGVLPSLSRRRARRAPLLCGFALVAAAFAPTASALALDVEPGKARCLQEMMQKHDLVKGSFKLLDAPTDGERANFEIKIFGPNEEVEFTKRDEVEGKFGFTAAEGGSHKVCFTNLAPVRRRFELDWAAGASAVDWEAVAKKESLKPLELALRKLQDRLESVQREMQYQREREDSHRDLSEVTNSRVVWFSLLTIFLVVSQGALQVWHLYSFFSRRKYINA